MPRIFFNLDEEELSEFEELVADRRRALNELSDIAGQSDQKERQQQLHLALEAIYNKIGVIFSNSRFYVENNKEE